METTSFLFLCFSFLSLNAIPCTILCKRPCSIILIDLYMAAIPNPGCGIAPPLSPSRSPLNKGSQLRALQVVPLWVPDTHVFKMLLTPAGPLIQAPVISFSVKATISPLNADSVWVCGRVTLVSGPRTRGVKIRLATLKVHHAQSPSTKIPIAEDLYREAYDYGLIGDFRRLFSEK